MAAHLVCMRHVSSGKWLLLCVHHVPGGEWLILFACIIFPAFEQLLLCVRHIPGGGWVDACITFLAVSSAFKQLLLCTTFLAFE